jgi:hypothetical protein
VEKVKIAEFAKAISQKESKDHVKPIYWDSAAAKASGYGYIFPSPTFQTWFALWCGGGLMPMLQAIGINLGRLLHWKMDLEVKDKSGQVCCLVQGVWQMRKI